MTVSLIFYIVISMSLKPNIVGRLWRELFPGMKVESCHQFRVTRNSDLWVDEEEVDDLLHAIKGELSSRNYGESVRLEVAADCPDAMADLLLENFHLAPADLYRVNGPVNLHRLIAVHELCDRSDLKYPAFIPRMPPRLEMEHDPFDVIRRGDVLLHHPYESFAPVVRLWPDSRRRSPRPVPPRLLSRRGLQSSCRRSCRLSCRGQ